MAIHTDDLLEKLDRVLAQPWLPPAAQCGWCRAPLTGREASLDFCAWDCQYIWHKYLAHAPMPDEGRGMDMWADGCTCLACVAVRDDRVMTEAQVIAEVSTFARMAEFVFGRAGVDPDS